MIGRIRLKLLTKYVQIFEKVADKIEDYCLRLNERYSVLASAEAKLKSRFMNDYKRYMDHTWIEANCVYPGSISTCPNAEALAAVITMEYHRIEKGLALYNRREGFGQDAVFRLVNAIEAQLDAHGPSDEGAIGVQVLSTYFKETDPMSLDESIVTSLSKYMLIREKYNEIAKGDTRGGYRVLASQQLAVNKKDALSFLCSRHSIRDYKQDQVDFSDIYHAVDVAIRAPSVCNRQAWRVYAHTDRAHIKRILELQNGNRGFSERIPLLFLICADIRRFTSIDERNQPWIDGGLFSMNLMMSLHAFGLGSCPLNWCATRENDMKLRSLLALPEYEVVVMLLSAGYLPSSFKITDSPRRSTCDILSINDQLSHE